MSWMRKVPGSFPDKRNISLVICDTDIPNKVCLSLTAGRWFSPASSTNKTDRHDIAEILLKVALNIITLAHTPITAKLVSSISARSQVYSIGYCGLSLVVDLWFYPEILVSSSIKLTTRYYWNIARECR